MNAGKKQTVLFAAFWAFAWIFLAWFLTRLTSEYFYTYILASFIWIIALGTTRIINLYLIPRFFLTKNYWRLAFMSLLLLVFSLWLELLGIVALFYYLLTVSENGKSGMPFLIDPVFLIAGLYLIVFAAATGKLISMILLAQKEKPALERLQPVAEADFQNKVTESPSILNSTDYKPYLTIRSNRKEYQVPVSDIVYIQALGDYVIIFMESGAKLMTLTTLTQIYLTLPENEFARIHRSYIVNKLKISATGSRFVEIGTVKLPVSRGYHSIKTL
jgi:hypothetical protein